MDKFSEKSSLSLGEFYVYALIDPRSNAIFISEREQKVEYLNTRKKA